MLHAKYKSSRPSISRDEVLTPGASYEQSDRGQQGDAAYQI